MKRLPSWVLVVAILLASAYAARAQNKITLLAPGPLGRETIDKLVMGFESKTGEKAKVTYSGAAGADYFFTPVAASSSAGAPTSFIYSIASDGMHMYSLENGIATLASSWPAIHL